MGRHIFWVLLCLPFASCAFAQGLVVLGIGESLQAAIDVAQTGSVIVLQGREWRENLTVTKDLVIVGEGAVVWSREPDRAVIEVEGEATVTLIGLVLEGAHTSREQCQGFFLPCGAGVSVRDRARVSLIDCELVDNARGVEAFDRSRVTLIGCEVRDNHFEGILVNQRAYLEAISSRVGPGNETGVLLRGSARIFLHGCTFRDSPGVWLWGEGEAVVRGCHFVGEGKEGRGFWAVYDSRFCLLDTTISGYGVGIAVGDAAVGTLYGVTVADCLVGIMEYTYHCGFAFAPGAFYGRLSGEITLQGNGQDLCPPEPEAWEGLTIKRH